MYQVTDRLVLLQAPRVQEQKKTKAEQYAERWDAAVARLVASGADLNKIQIVGRN